MSVSYSKRHELHTEFDKQLYQLLQNAPELRDFIERETMGVPDRLSKSEFEAGHREGRRSLAAWLWLRYRSIEKDVREST